MNRKGVLGVLGTGVPHLSPSCVYACARVCLYVCVCVYVGAFIEETGRREKHWKMVRGSFFQHRGGSWGIRGAEQERSKLVL